MKKKKTKKTQESVKETKYPGICATHSPGFLWQLVLMDVNS